LIKPNNDQKNSFSDGTNDAVAEKLREMADLLAVQQEDGFRVSAYRRAAQTLNELSRPITTIVSEEGLDGLIALPGIGHGIAAAIVEMLNTGRWSQLERLTGQTEPEELFQTIPSIGPITAARIHDELHIDTLEQLEQAAHDGRLAQVTGIGDRRSAFIRSMLAERLGHQRIRHRAADLLPSVSLLLDVDEEYRTKASRNQLKTIAPKRFNPKGEAWLPVLHTRRNEWLFTVLFSNTERAHALDKTNDWVVIYFHTESGPESQCTVVTDTRGLLTGYRVIRGREGDCIAHYSGAFGNSRLPVTKVHSTND
jgi:DNA polymerase (family X)